MIEHVFLIKKNDKSDFTKEEIFDSINLFQSFFAPSIRKIFQPKFEYYNSSTTFHKDKKQSYLITCYYDKIKSSDEEAFRNFIHSTIFLYNSSTYYYCTLMR